MNLNFFAEKHGKNGRDAHFSNIARFIKAESLIRKLVCSEDIVNAINSRQAATNDNKNSNNLFYRHLPLIAINIFEIN